jgi:hypothetical protein
MRSRSIRVEASFVQSKSGELALVGLLSSLEIEALKLLLSNHPNCGELLDDSGIRCIQFAGTVVTYAVALEINTVYLFGIRSLASPKPTATKKSQFLVRSIDFLSKGLLVIAVRRGLKWIWDYLSHS